MIRLSHQIKFKSSRKHYIKYLSSDRIKNFVVESKIRFLIINIRNIIFVRESIRKHIYWFSSIHFILQYFRWIQYQLFKVSHRRLRHQKSSHYIRNLVITSEIFDRIFISRSNSNHLFASKIFQNSIYFDSKSIVLFYSFDEINRIKKSFNISTKSSNRFYYFYSTSFLISIFELFVLLENLQKLHLLTQQIDFDSSTFVMKLITFRIQISNQFFKFLSSLFDISTRIQYWNHLSSLRTSRNHIDFICKESCFSRFDVEFNIVSSKTTKIFEHISIRIIFLLREVFKNTSNCLANWSFSSTSSMTSILNRLEIFNSTFFYDWFEDELFNQIANFLQHFQQCLHLYCESKLLDLLIIVLVDSVSAWFDDQTKFISLHDFDITLTKTFSFNKFVMIQSTLISSKSFASLISSSSQKQQKLKIKFEASKFKKVSKTEQIVKSTSTLQNIDIFDSTLTFDEFEFDLYKEIANFLQHFQQCQHLYRKSNMLNLLSKCLCDFASEWFKI